VDNGGNGWRIFPMGLASVRLADVTLRHYQWRTLIPNYFSFGATVKSNSSSGTNLEYLLGPSWVSLGQHVIFTGGAYAGSVNKLGGGLIPGLQTGTVPTTLPLSTPYQWGYGFAISYKIASQGANNSTTANSSGNK
jgi:hypothetical protein